MTVRIFEKEKTGVSASTSSLSDMRLFGELYSSALKIKYTSTSESEGGLETRR